MRPMHAALVLARDSI